MNDPAQAPTSARSTTPHGPPPGRTDVAWMLLVIAVAAIEVAATPGLGWSSPAAILTVALSLTILWRRERPLAMIVVGFGLMPLLHLLEGLRGEPIPDMITMAFLLVLPYSLFRWGTRTEMRIGALLALSVASIDMFTTNGSVEDVIGGYAVLTAAMAVGFAARSRAQARQTEIERAKSRERESIARDLHDTVAHHISAITIRAQAGLAVAEARPEAAAEALRIIEREAKTTLTEMRAMVRTLRRDDEAAERAPTPMLDDLRSLAGTSPNGLEVSVTVDASVGDVTESVSTALYRIAQESVTNARRHAQRATRVDVEVTGDEEEVHLRVWDDGERVVVRPSSTGYGIVGMTERAELLGGVCHTGPNPDRGWTVSATLPRHGPAS